MKNWHPYPMFFGTLVLLKMIMRLGKSQYQVAYFLFIYNRNFNNTVEFIFKNLIKFFDDPKLKSVGYERCGINLTMREVSLFLFG